MNNELARWLASELEKRGWSIRETARRAGLSHTPIANILANRTNPGLDVLVKLADALGKSREDVFRMAGILPSLPGIDDDASIVKTLETMKRLTPEVREGAAALTTAISESTCGGWAGGRA